MRRDKTYSNGEIETKPNKISGFTQTNAHIQYLYILCKHNRQNRKNFASRFSRVRKHSILIFVCVYEIYLKLPFSLKKYYFICIRLLFLGDFKQKYKIAYECTLCICNCQADKARYISDGVKKKYCRVRDTEYERTGTRIWRLQTNILFLFPPVHTLESMQ